MRNPEETFEVNQWHRTVVDYDCLLMFRYEESTHPDSLGSQLIRRLEDETCEDFLAEEYQHLLDIRCSGEHVQNNHAELYSGALEKMVWYRPFPP